MRQVDPEQLEHLAKLLDGGDGLEDGLAQAFTRASRLGVTSLLTSLRPIQSWVTDTAPDLRRRAALARLDDGDPTAGLRMVGFTSDDLESFDGAVPAEALLLANSVAAAEDGEWELPSRDEGEGIDDYLNRLVGGALSQFPGLEVHEASLTKLVTVGRELITFGTAGLVVATQSKSLYNYSRFGVGLSAPGSWLHTQLFPRLVGPTIGRLTEFGRLEVVRNRAFGAVWDGARRLPGMNAAVFGLSANGAMNFFIGSDTLAATTVGAARASQANLLKAFGSGYESLRAAGASRGSSLAGGMSTAGKVSGLLRGVGVVGGVASTGYSLAHVLSQDAGEAWEEDKWGYMADWAEVGFNASLTAAMVCPNPATVTFVVVTGLAYGGLKVRQHWGDITEFTGNAVDTLGDAYDVTTEALGEAVDVVGDTAGELIEGAKDLGNTLNPTNWW